MARRAGDPRPAHQKLAAELRAQIMSGDLAVGQMLPSINELSRDYSMAAATVAKALAVLKAEGLVHSRRGKGVWVAPRSVVPIETTAHLTPAAGYRYELIAVAEVAPPDDVRQALGLYPDRPVIKRQRLLLQHDEPVELSASYYDAVLARDTAIAEPKRIPGGAIRVLAELGYTASSFVDRVSARMPTPEETELLHLPPGTPVIRQLRVLKSTADKPIEVSILVKGGNRTELLYTQDVG